MRLEEALALLRWGKEIYSGSLHLVKHEGEYYFIEAPYQEEPRQRSRVGFIMADQLLDDSWQVVED